MNVVDLEILIPASPEFLWRFLGDLSAIPKWHDEVVSVAFLSTQREGRGARWRQSTVKGNDVIAEISAWYDTLGYEYRLVDGTTYSQNQGRIRLQEATDGTLVRWTFQYEAGGVLGGLRNAMRLRRRATNQIQDSLRNLHQLIVQESGGISTHEAKASMREAPDVDERSSYQSRHPSAFQEAAAEVDADGESPLSERPPLAYELETAPEALPLVVDSDTKPNPVVLGAAVELTPQAEPEPAIDDTQPVEVETLLAEIPPLESPPSAPAPEPIAELPPAPELPAEPEPSIASRPPQPAGDSSQLSVFEIFGLQKPSEAKAGASLDARPRESQRPDFQQSASFEARLNGLDESRQATEDASPADSPEAGRTLIAGWRRSARRNKTLLRTHT